jgi:hypothetical protein
MIPKMIPNPEWTASQEAKLQKQLTMDDMARRGECCEDAFPEDFDRDLPASGAWIMLLVSVRVGRQVDDRTTKIITVPHLSMWYAMPHVSNMRVMLRPMGKRTREREFTFLRQAVINTPDGAIHVWPHEYQKIDITKFLDLCEEDGLFIHYLSDKARVDESALFYLRSRGIAKADAQRMLLGTLTDSNYCYFTVSPEVAEVFGEGAGMPYLCHENHQRRAESSAKRKCALPPEGGQTK